MASAHRIVTPVYDKVQLLDLAGPADVFTASAGYEMAYVAATPSVRSTSGLTLAAEPLPAKLTGRYSILIPGSPSRRALEGLVADAAFMAWLRRACDGAQRVMSVCSGAFVLGRLGLLDGRRATTHWRGFDDFATELPDVRLDRQALFVEDGRLWTSAGVTSGVDMALAVVTRDLGREAALKVARELVLHLVRPGGQSQFAEPLKLQVRAGADLEGLIPWLEARLAEPVTIPQMADAVGMSERNLHRRCSSRLGMTPARLLLELRMERARTLLSDAEAAIQQVAHACGFTDAAAFSTAFQRRYGVTPTSYRLSFAPP